MIGKGLGMLSKGKGLDTVLSGLDTLIRAAFLRPVQIMRQFISNPGIGISSISTYHANIGLSRPAQNARESRRITTIPDGISNPYRNISLI
jgi:hypothetical protein